MIYTTRKEATLNGEMRYFTGKPCPKNHIALRDTANGGCVECANEYKRWKYHTQTKSHQNKKSKEWRANNKDKVVKHNIQFRLNNPSYFSEWKKENKGIVNASTYKRRTAKMRRMPKWANIEKIKELYKQAVIKSKETGVQWHVDHIIPLQGELVSGLHVPENLQVIPGVENVKKANRYIIE